jgi:myo-inositol-1(or 4)-monophosphatase
MALRSALINVMAKACHKAARGLLRDFGEVENLQVSRKGPADFVSTADTDAERTLVAELKKARPAYGFLLEEGNEIESTDPNGQRWIIDPLDGTTNYLHGIPHWAISIGLEEKGEVIAGMIYDPIRDDLYWGERGRGSYLNDKRLRVSGRRNMIDALFATGAPFAGHGEHELFLNQMRSVMAATSGVRRMGAASLDLAYVASGRFEGFWESHLHPWDIAAGSLIVKEAGGYITDFRGRDKSMENGEVVCGNDRLHHRLLKMLRDAGEVPRGTAEEDA